MNARTVIINEAPIEIHLLFKLNNFFVMVYIIIHNKIPRSIIDRFFGKDNDSIKLPNALDEPESKGFKSAWKAAETRKIDRTNASKLKIIKPTLLFLSMFYRIVMSI